MQELLYQIKASKGTNVCEENLKQRHGEFFRTKIWFKKNTVIQPMGDVRFVARTW